MVVAGASVHLVLVPVWALVVFGVAEREIHHCRWYCSLSFFATEICCDWRYVAFVSKAIHFDWQLVEFVFEKENDFDWLLDSFFFEMESDYD